MTASRSGRSASRGAGRAIFVAEIGGDLLRMRTLILLRWGAIIGQLGAIAVARWVYDIDLNIGLCLLAVGASVIVNLVAISIFPENKRLTETESVLALMFDAGQLAFLLFLTGGLNNPFALFILVPATIAATALHKGSAILIGGVTIGLVALVTFVHQPLSYADGTTIAVPTIFELGFLLAIVLGVVFLGVYSWRVASETGSMRDALLATQMALAREQKLTDLGGVVAAAAHELGTPLATIKLVSAELADELADRPELRADADLIREQADRCRDILRSMGRAGKDDLHMRSAPLMAVVREAAEPHAARGKTLHFTEMPAAGQPPRQPSINRLPEVIHGLRNLVQNAVDFARANVWIDVGWSADRVLVRIVDDGPGYPAQLLGRIGDPFVRRRRNEAQRENRPGYEGMGLGLFIAKTLLERTGAEISFANGADPFLNDEERPERSGAIVEVIWHRDSIETADSGALGENRPIET